VDKKKSPSASFAKRADSVGPILHADFCEFGSEIVFKVIHDDKNMEIVRATYLWRLMMQTSIYPYNGV
jgi:hypothetical protein